jgi:hypothetical protein
LVGRTDKHSASNAFMYCRKIRNNYYFNRSDLRSGGVDRM